MQLENLTISSYMVHFITPILVKNSILKWLGNHVLSQELQNVNWQTLANFVLAKK